MYIQVSMHALCNGDLDEPVRIECWDLDSRLLKEEDDMIGWVDTSVRNMLTKEPLVLNDKPGPSFFVFFFYFFFYATCSQWSPWSSTTDPVANTHTHTHTYTTHARTHTHTHIHTCIYIHTYTYIHTHTHTHTQTHVYVHMCIYTYSMKRRRRIRYHSRTTITKAINELPVYYRYHIKQATKKNKQKEKNHYQSAQ